MMFNNYFENQFLNDFFEGVLADEDNFKVDPNGFTTKTMNFMKWRLSSYNELE